MDDTVDIPKEVYYYAFGEVYHNTNICHKKENASEPIKIHYIQGIFKGLLPCLNCRSQIFEEESKRLRIVSPIILAKQGPNYAQEHAYTNEEVTRIISLWETFKMECADIPVYVNFQSGVYHDKLCGFIKEDMKTCTLADAEEKKCRPCSQCLLSANYQEVLPAQEKLKKERVRNKKKWANTTPEQKEAHNARGVSWYNALSDEQKQARIDTIQAKEQQRRENMTEEENRKFKAQRAEEQAARRKKIAEENINTDAEEKKEPDETSIEEKTEKKRVRAVERYAGLSEEEKISKRKKRNEQAAIRKEKLPPEELERLKKLKTEQKRIQRLKKSEQ